ncbi:CAP domain-containing protein [Spongiibacter nanhainus]|uniref:CAP domain-containing protein n=1 Tax=Spongiibacter nanhainus TaxID=2794344 RepID=A0A7T4R221_9GAMM|nr:CAP domain-containing protein [Spongiibacter nanhainus]QQD18985.1 CAP domain-containing protein [Spongiibacter nanhainus]
MNQYRNSPPRVVNAVLLLLSIVITACASAPTASTPPGSRSGSAKGPAVALTDATSGKGQWSVAGWDTARLSTAQHATYLSPMERRVILHLNMLRSDPGRYAREFIEPRIKYYQRNIYRPPWTPEYYGGTLTKEGVSALREAIKDLSAAPPVGLLMPSKGLAMAARDHARDKARHGGMSHTDSRGRELDTRVEQYGYWYKRIAENISYGRDAAVDNIVGLLIDDGVPSRGHRKSLITADFKKVGVAMAGHPRFGHVCVINLAAGFEE